MIVESQNRIERIRYCEAEADRIEANPRQVADEYRWEAARLIAEELESGRTQHEVAADIGKSQPHVSTMLKLHKARDYYLGNKSAYPSFDHAYKHVERQTSEGREERDVEIAKLSDEGVSGRAIGKKLGIDEKTVRKTLERVHNGTESPRDSGRVDGCGLDNSVLDSIDELRTSINQDLREVRRIRKIVGFTSAERAALTKLLQDAVTRYGQELTRVEQGE